MTSRRQMRLGLSMRYHGYHLGAWRHPDVPEAGTLDYRYFLNTARLAERAKFDMVFFADGIGIRVRDEPEGSLCRSPQTVELEPLDPAVGDRDSHRRISAWWRRRPRRITNRFILPANTPRWITSAAAGRDGISLPPGPMKKHATFGRDKHLDYETRYERAGGVRPGGDRSVGKLGRRCAGAGQGVRVVFRSGETACAGSQGEAFLGARPAEFGADAAGPSRSWCRRARRSRGRKSPAPMRMWSIPWRSNWVRRRPTTHRSKTERSSIGRSPDAVKVLARIHAVCRPHRSRGARPIRRHAQA